MLATSSRLSTGFTPGEVLFTLLLIGFLGALAARQVPDLMASVAAMEAFELSTGPKVAWVEYWATTGQLPPGPGPDIAAARPNRTGEREGRYFPGPPVIGSEGSVTYTFGPEAKLATGQRLTLRAAFGPGEIPATLMWVCGRSPIAPGFTVAGKDLTTMTRDVLPSPCRQLLPDVD
jgi:hypothetical protein